MGHLPRLCGTGFTKEEAERIVACVNACRGIANDKLIAAAEATAWIARKITRSKMEVEVVYGLPGELLGDVGGEIP